jgi:hypothetical protein
MMQPENSTPREPHAEQLAAMLRDIYGPLAARLNRYKRANLSRTLYTLADNARLDPALKRGAKAELYLAIAAATPPHRLSYAQDFIRQVWEVASKQAARETPAPPPKESPANEPRRVDLTVPSGHWKHLDLEAGDVIRVVEVGRLIPGDVGAVEVINSSDGLPTFLIGRVAVAGRKYVTLEGGESCPRARVPRSDIRFTGYVEAVRRGWPEYVYDSEEWPDYIDDGRAAR